MKKILRISVTWELDGLETPDLPSFFDFPMEGDVDPEMDLSDTIEELSDMYGYLILDADVSVHEEGATQNGKEVDERRSLNPELLDSVRDDRAGGAEVEED